MPTYEYRCESCGHVFEQFQSITAEPVKECPQCSRPKVRRLIGTGAALLFKGSGFYQTDYRSKTYSEAAKSDCSSAGSSTGSGNSTSGSSTDASSSGTRSSSSNGSNGSNGSRK